MLTNDQIATKIINLMWSPKEDDSAEFAVQLFMEHLLLDKGEESWTRDEMYRLIKKKLCQLDSEKGSIYARVAAETS
ncbi:hypothetical protein [Paenibacillus sp. Marseille-Q4541]|uniref:hypothetical protein n=1 Tax=Paenibacillus sp. Marseille-Q4541 TaxID=2831522 RepID=UPI001BA784AE|nr:hypothetical protein [Paenibacillus sp. Marseille-Q4541]